MGGLGRFVEQLRKDGISFQGLQQQQQQPKVQVGWIYINPWRFLFCGFFFPQSSSTASNEDADLRRAIEISLRDSNPAPSSASASSLYPTMPLNPSPTPTKKVLFFFVCKFGEGESIAEPYFILISLMRIIMYRYICTYS